MKLGLSVNLVERLIDNRREKAALVMVQLIQPKQNDTFLEIGGPSVEFKKASTQFGELLVLNRDRKHIASSISSDSYLQASFIVGDGCHIPFLDSCVNFCFSHATIEHVPPHLRNIFCQEMKRVSTKAYFITTPNFWFPFEFHYMMPFFQFLPRFLQKKMKKLFTFSHISENEEVALLRSIEIKALLGQTSEVVELNRLIGIPATLLGWSKK